MESSHLKNDELIFELACRNVKPLPTHDLRCLQLRVRLARETYSSVIAARRQPFTFEVNVVQIRDTMGDIEAELGKDVMSPIAYAKVRSRLLHL